MALSAVIVVPARDEEATVVRCLEALAAQTVATERFEIILVADACTDATEALARAAARTLGLTLTVLTGPGLGSGPARRTGMDHAAGRLTDAGRPDGLIATTDSDSRPEADWLERQLTYLAGGARVVAGDIELDDEEAARLPDGVIRRREHDAALRLASVSAREPGAGHHHFAGASLGIAARDYLRVGGIGTEAALEDEAFFERLRAHGIPILRAADVRVRTSARSDGRAVRGLALDLAVSVWRERRRYTADSFDPAVLRTQKGPRSVTVIVPTLECVETIGGVLTETVGPWRQAGLVDEVVVVDASRDGTAAAAAAAGARVLHQDEVLTEYGPALGKGDAMWRGLHQTSGEIVCFLDGDTEDPHPRHLGVLGPLLSDPTIALVKGAFERPLCTGAVPAPNEGGRVTELMARPLLNLHEPRLAGFAQPLAGEFAARRALLEELSFPAGYGVEIAVLIDALRRCGLDALAECHLGTRQNRHQPLRALGEMAFAVLAAVERRLEPPRSPTAGQFLLPWQDGAIMRVPIVERPPLRHFAQRVA
jgi:glycosyltransferase involved in cell wall biosynthesis